MKFGPADDIQSAVARLDGPTQAEVAARVRRASAARAQARGLATWDGNAASLAPWRWAVGEQLVRVRNVSKAYGSKEALRSVSFEVPPGQICGLLGPNGAGKTTLFRLLMGIVKATSGSITVGGLDAFEDRVATKRLIGFVPDEPVFFSYLSGWETLRLSAAMHGMGDRATQDVVGPLIERMQLAGELTNYAEDYSRGTKKKLALLLAVLHRPRLLVLDEPTNGLDVEATQLFHELVREQAMAGVTVLFSTHLMDHVARLCSRVVVISQGTVAADDHLETLRAAYPGAELEAVFLRLTALPAEA